jgi:hypothetical protein
MSRTGEMVGSAREAWTMRNTLSLLGMLAMVVACSEGDGNDDAAGSEDAGTIGDDSGGSTGGDTGVTSVTSATATTIPTTTNDTTTSDSESTGGPEDTGDPESTGGGALGCAEYCEIYLGACPDFNEYANEADCMANCEQWPLGEAADTAHDSLGCRTYHATVAASTDPSLHCPHAGPSGAATCVAEDAPTCDVYCMRYFDNCMDDLNVFPDMAACMTECGTWYAGTFKDVDGHTVGCHSYHANAAMGDADLHCPHAATGGGGICVL